MDLLIVVHIKSSYDAWKAVFESDPAVREEFADDTRTRVAKVDDNTAMVQLFDVDMQKCLKFLTTQIHLLLKQWMNMLKNVTYIK